MKELKFRLWNEDKREMGIVSRLEFTFYGKLVKPKYIQIMQYTGLKDKNGVEIYEGDAVSLDFPYTKTNAEVIFKDGQFFPNSKCETIYSRMWYKDCLVMGNKYENPELLEVEQ